MAFIFPGLKHQKTQHLKVLHFGIRLVLVGVLAVV